MSDPTAQDGSLHLTREQATLIATRALTAYILLWVFDDLTLLPHQLLSVAHYMKETGSVLGANTRMPITRYTLRFYILDLLGSSLRIAVLLMAAGWFYRCGPRIRRFFAAGAG
jgi:hypothetical protein